jgi:diadenosine tetraphosphate (Ap4A) HIT family hydrolase
MFNSYKPKSKRHVNFADTLRRHAFGQIKTPHQEPDMNSDFELHPQLAEDTHPLAELSCCRLLLMNNQRYPWLILVPRQANYREWHHLPVPDQTAAFAEVMHVSRCVEALFSPDKINVAALGNVVPQLHIHVIARFTNDDCWPTPVWGKHAPQPYASSQAEAVINRVLAWLAQNK